MRQIAIMSKEFGLSLKRFPMADMPRNSRIGIIGRPGTGKSTLIFDILYNHRTIPMGIVMSGTEESNQAYSEHIPDTFIYGHYAQNKIDALVARQKKTRKKEEIMKRRTGGDVDPNHVFLVLDDCMDNKAWIKNITTQGLFKNGRHWNILFLLAMQYSMDIPPALRTGFDYVFILKENIMANKKRLYEHYCGIFPSFDMFCQTLDYCTENYGCIVIDNRNTSNKVNDVVFWYKADHAHASTPFRVGSEGFWKYHKNNYDTEYDDSDDDEDRYVGSGGLQITRQH